MSINFDFIEGHQAYTSEMAFVLYELDQAFFPTPWSKDSWEKLFNEHERLLVTLKANEITIGFCLFDLNAVDSFAHLLKIVIHPELRNKGYSKKLLNEALLNLEKKGFTQFFLEVEESNLAAQKLYKSSGFKIIHRKKDFYGENRAALIMTKELCSKVD